MIAARHRPIVFVSALTLAAFVLRAASTYRGGIWADEGLVFNIVTIPAWKDMFAFLAQHESHPPLFYVIVRLWMLFFGTSDTVVLLLPIIAGALIVPATYFVATRVFSRSTGIIAASLAAFSPSLTEHASQLRPYGILPVIVLLSFYFLIRAVLSGSRYWIAYAITTAAGLYTHHWIWLVCAGEAAAVLYLRRFSQDRGRILIRFMLSALGALLLYAPWLGTFLFQATHTGHPAPPIDGAVEKLGFVVFAILNAPTMLFLSAAPAAIGTTVLSAVLVCGLFIVGRKAWLTRESSPSSTPSQSVATPEEQHALRAMCIMAAVPICLALGMSLWSEMFLSRCVVMLTPLLLIAAARVFVRWTESGQRLTILQASIVAVASCILLASLISLIQTPRANTRDVAASLVNLVEPSDLLIVAPQYRAPSFNHYFPQSVEQIDYPQMHRSREIDFTRVLDTSAHASQSELRLRVADARQKGRRIWVVTGRTYLDLANQNELDPNVIKRSHSVAAKWLKDVRDVVASEYQQPPDTTHFVHKGRTRYEEMLPLLFVPDSSGR